MNKRPARPKPSDQLSSEPEGFDAWQTRAETALEQTHGVTRGTIPNAEWTKLYIRNLSPEEAADAAERSAYNKRSHADRLRRR